MFLFTITEIVCSDNKEYNLKLLIDFIANNYFCDKKAQT